MPWKGKTLTICRRHPKSRIFSLWFIFLPLVLFSTTAFATDDTAAFFRDKAKLKEHNTALATQLSLSGQSSSSRVGSLVDVLAEVGRCSAEIQVDSDVDGDHRISLVDSAAKELASRYSGLLMALGWLQAHMPVGDGTQRVPTYGWGNDSAVLDTVFAPAPRLEGGARMHAPIYPFDQIGSFVRSEWFTDAANAAGRLNEDNAALWLDIAAVPRSFAVKPLESSQGLSAVSALVDEYRGELETAYNESSGEDRRHPEVEAGRRWLNDFPANAEAAIVLNWLLESGNLPYFVSRWYQLADRIYAKNKSLPAIALPDLPRSIAELPDFYEDLLNGVRTLIAFGEKGGKPLPLAADLESWADSKTKAARTISESFSEAIQGDDRLSLRLVEAAGALGVGDVRGIRIAPTQAALSTWDQQWWLFAGIDGDVIESVLELDPFFSDIRGDDLNGDCQIDDSDIAIWQDVYNGVNDACLAFQANPQPTPNHPYGILCANWPNVLGADGAPGGAQLTLPPRVSLGAGWAEYIRDPASELGANPALWQNVPYEIMDPLWQKFFAENRPPKDDTDFRGKALEHLDALVRGDYDEQDPENHDLGNVRQALNNGSLLGVNQDAVRAGVTNAYSERGWGSIDSQRKMDEEASTLADATADAKVLWKQNPTDPVLIQNLLVAKTRERVFAELIEGPTLRSFGRFRTTIAKTAEGSYPRPWLDIIERQNTVLGSRSKAEKKKGSPEEAAWRRDVLEPLTTEMGRLQNEYGNLQAYFTDIGYTPEVHRFYVVAGFLVGSGQAHVLLNRLRDGVIDVMDERVVVDKTNLME